jgi:hypothetical protein
LQWLLRSLNAKMKERYNLEGSHDHPVELSRCAESWCNAKLLCKQRFALAASNEHDQINIHLERLLSFNAQTESFKQKQKKTCFCQSSQLSIYSSFFYQQL